MKAINNPLRPKIDVIFGSRNRAALKTISRRQHRAAERELFRREDLAAAAHVLADRRRIQALHRSAKRDVQRLIAETMAQAREQQAQNAEQDALPHPLATAHLWDATKADRMLVQQQVTIVRRGPHRDTRTVLAMASCAI